MNRWDQLTFSVFVLMCLAGGLKTTQSINECFSWAIGEDWDAIPMSQWRERARQRIGLDLSQDATFEKVIFTIIEKWKKEMRDEAK